MSDGEPAVSQAAILLGSNIHPDQNLPAAVRELSLVVKVCADSNAWESAPVGFSDQANFLNAAVLIETSLGAQELKQTVLRPIEEKLGRVRDPKNINGPRTIDLDLAILISPSGSQILEREILTRSFIAIPLAEILPDFVHPQTGQTLREIAHGLEKHDTTLKLRTDCDLGTAITNGT